MYKRQGLDRLSAAHRLAKRGAGQAKQGDREPFAGHHKPAFTEMFRQAADAENEASSDPTLLGASFYDWVIEDICETPHLSRWVVSISGKRYEYTGGAHGNTTFFNANY